MAAPLSPSSGVKIADGIVHRDLQGELILLNLNSGTYFGLDQIGTSMWRLLQEGHSLEQIVHHLSQEYDVTEERCRNDLLALVAQLKEKGILELTSDMAP